ncbi:iron dependent repressor, metal binding and dimerization domain protein [Fontisphaera persica]|uniref:metal-dependent transcriptional regulator n=1 Tax=Fontisphaera persica TaxID=2974023 RepID=UPI0024BF18BD|nr:iron dependent repressor, metal binding and dimerization domain protein [Fontisphaera persica]WCJ59827.1 iron dependent repressor, metal binding and dimerization domain protein [Fontisphaera persica]
MSKTMRQKTRGRRRSKNSQANPSISAEDYLERMAELIEAKGFARAVDLAAALDISQPSVTAMAQRLAREGYVVYEKYRRLQLTESGQDLAAKIRRRHATLQCFLSLLGVDQQTQEDDIEGWEHCLSADTLERLGRLTDFIRARPALLAELQANMTQPAVPPATTTS